MIKILKNGGLSLAILLAVASCSSTKVFEVRNSSQGDSSKINRGNTQKSSYPSNTEGLRAINPRSDSGDIDDKNRYKQKNVFDAIKAGFSMPKIPRKKIRRQIKLFTKNPEYLNRMFERSRRYIFYVHSEVSKRKLPAELTLLPFVESAYNPHATSRAKAAGLWQFIPATGVRYGLTQNWWSDERRSVQKATQSALDYLEYLHKLKNNDWFLALASYNWGERSVRRAIDRNKRAKRKTDYLSLRMPRETRNYIPKLLAMREIIINPEKYNVVLPFIPNEPYFSSIEMEQSIDLAKVSDLSEVDVSELKSLNANLLRPIFNKKHASNILLPSYNSIIFKKNYKNFLKRREPTVEWGAVRLKKTSSISEIAKNFGVDESELSEANGIRSSKIKLRKGSTFIIKVKNNALDNSQRIESFKRANLKFLYPDKIFHKVKRGDTLSTIARKYRTTVKTLKRLNNIRGSLIRIGQQIRVRISSPENQETKPNVHKVRRGESLYKIAKRYKTTVAELKRINKLGNDLIIAGTKLLIR